MASSFSNILIHVVFSTKHREPLIADAWRGELQSYMSSVAGNLDCPPLAINSVPDHVHILLPLARTVTIGDVVRDIKVASSKWVGKRGLSATPFAWQTGYGAFSVSESHSDAVKNYIQNQAEHHKKMSFRDEFLTLLRRNRMAFDEKYIFE